jgi:hypothetical protein
MSAEADGWYVESKEDTQFHGVCKIREALLNDAFVNPETKFIRYLDDDDILLPHRDKIKEVFDANPDVHIIYMDYIMTTPSGITHNIKYSGNPIEDCLQIHPWSWVARVEALHRVKDVYGYLWDHTVHREGGNTWLSFLQLNAKILHVPIEAYQYNKSFDPRCVSQQDGSLSTYRLERELKNLKVRILL